MAQLTDPVNRPPHYTYSKIETIDVIEAWGLNYRMGNAVKYISRANHKGSTIQDLEKAIWYLQREVESLEADSWRNRSVVKDGDPAYRQQLELPFRDTEPSK